MKLFATLALIVALALAAPAQTSFFSDRGVAVQPLGRGLIPISYGQVRVCDIIDKNTSSTPCPDPSVISDINGVPLSITGGGFGQLKTDILGRFSFQCTTGTSYWIQVAASSDNTPQQSYPMSCGGGTGGGGGGGSRWDQLTNPTSSMLLLFGDPNFQSTFEYSDAGAMSYAFGFFNDRTATPSTSQPSPLLKFVGQGWGGPICPSACSSVFETWDLQAIVKNGTQGGSTFTFTREGGGTTGPAYVGVPGLVISGNAANEFIAINGAFALTAPGVGNSGFGFDNDTKFKISESNGSFYSVTDALAGKVPCGASSCSLALNSVLLGNNSGNVLTAAAGGLGTVFAGTAGAPAFLQQLQLGGANASPATGALALCGASSVGNCVTIQSQATFTGWNFNLPTTAGAAGTCLTSQGGGAAVMTWSACSGGGGGSSAISALTAATVGNTIANGDFNQTWNWQLTTNNGSALTLQDVVASTGTNTNILSIATANGSTARPLSIAQGTGPSGNAAPASSIVTGTGGAAANATSNGNSGGFFNLFTGAGSNGGATSGDGGNGGTLSFSTGQAGVANGSGNTGGNGGALTVQTGQGGNGGSSGLSGNGGNVSFNLGKAGTVGTTKGVTGEFQIFGTAPSSVGTAGISVGSEFSLTGITGGASSGSGTTAGIGSTYTLSTGAGGAGTGTNTIGGAGGNSTHTMGNGGASTGTAINAKGGDAIWNLGAAGTGGSGTAGAPGQFKIVGATLAGNLTGPFVNITGTWNTTGVIDAAFLMNIANTASATGSLLMDLQLAGVTKFSLDKAGLATYSGIVNKTTNYFSLGSASNASPAGTLIMDAPAGFLQLQADAGAGATLGGQLHLESTNGPNGLNTASLLAGSNGIQMDTATGTRINSDTAKKTIITGPGSTQFGDVGGTGGSTSYVGTTSGTQTLACDSLSLCTAFRMTGTLLLGTDATTAGIIKLSNGGGSGASYTLDNNAATTAITEHLPALAASGLRTGTNSSGTVTGGWSGDTNHIVTSTGLTASLGTTTLCTTGNCPAGMYHVDVYMNEAGTGCTTVGAGGVAPTLTWADGVSTKSAQPMGGFTQAGNSAGAGKMLFAAGGTNDATYSDVIRSDGSATIQIATTLTACTTPGPWAGYNIRAVIYPVSGQ